jgi:hypothetical protein
VQFWLLRFGRGAGALTLAFVAWLGAASAGLAQDKAVESFYGVWLGSAVTESKTDEGFKVTSRELYASILPADDGFSMEWAAIRRKGSDDSTPIRMQVAQFVATDKPNVWRTEPNESPLDGVFTYARLRDGMLSVYNIGVDDRGVLETQIYHRSVVKGEMQLEFTRVVDGTVVRTVKGTLTQSSE